MQPNAKRPSDNSKLRFHFLNNTLQRAFPPHIFSLLFSTIQCMFFLPDTCIVNFYLLLHWRQEVSRIQTNKFFLDKCTCSTSMLNNSQTVNPTLALVLTYHLLIESEVITVQSRTEALMAPSSVRRHHSDARTAHTEGLAGRKKQNKNKKYNNNNNNNNNNINNNKYSRTCTLTLTLTLNPRDL